MLVGCHSWNRWLKRAPCAINLPEKKLFQARGRKDYGSIYTYTQTYIHTHGWHVLLLHHVHAVFLLAAGAFPGIFKMGWHRWDREQGAQETTAFIINLNTLGLVCFSASCHQFIRCKEVLHTHLNIDYLVLDNCV